MNIFFLVNLLALKFGTCITTIRMIVWKNFHDKIPIFELSGGFQSWQYWNFSHSKFKNDILIATPLYIHCFNLYLNGSPYHQGSRAGCLHTSSIESEMKSSSSYRLNGIQRQWRYPKALRNPFLKDRVHFLHWYTLVHAIQAILSSLSQRGGGGGVDKISLDTWRNFEQDGVRIKLLHSNSTWQKCITSPNKLKCITSPNTKSTKWDAWFPQRKCWRSHRL